MPEPTSSFLKIARWVVYIGFALAYVVMLLHSARKISLGEGLEVYYSVKLLRWNHVGALIALLALPVALAAGWLYTLRQRRREDALERDLIAKYPAKNTRDGGDAQ